MQQVLLAWFGAIVLLFVLLKGAIDTLASIDYAQETFPFLKRWSATKKWHRIVLLATCLFYGGTLYELLKEPPLFTPPIPNSGTLSIVEVAKENRDLRAELAVLTKPAPPNSLRHRTFELVNELNLFWANRPTPPPQPVPNPMSDIDRARNARWDRYEKETRAAYQSREFNQRILGIVRDYQAKGVSIGYLDKAAEQPERFIGSSLPSPDGGFSLDPCDQFMSELCRFRELAFHVDAYDARVDPTKF